MRTRDGQNINANLRDMCTNLISNLIGQWVEDGEYPADMKKTRGDGAGYLLP